MKLKFKAKEEENILIIAFSDPAKSDQEFKIELKSSEKDEFIKVNEKIIEDIKLIEEINSEEFDKIGSNVLKRVCKTIAETYIKEIKEVRKRLGIEKKITIKWS